MRSIIDASLGIPIIAEWTDTGSRMLPTFVIALREGIEASLIVGIVAAFLASNSDRRALRWMWVGVGAGVTICLAAGIGLDALDRSLPQAGQERLESVIALTAVAMVTWMIVWMKRNARGLRASLEHSAAAALASGTVLALVGMAFLAVLREGFETAVFLLAAFDSSTDPAAAGMGVILGLAAAAAIGYGIYRGGVRFNLSRFFRATGVVLVLIAAGLVSFAIHTAHEGGWVSALQAQAVDLHWLVAPGTVRASLLTSVLGLQPQPTVAEALGWTLYAVPMTLYVLWPARTVPAPRPSPAPALPVAEVR